MLTNETSLLYKVLEDSKHITDLLTQMRHKTAASHIVFLPFNAPQCLNASSILQTSPSIHTSEIDEFLRPCLAYHQQNLSRSDSHLVSHVSMGEQLIIELKSADHFTLEPLISWHSSSLVCQSLKALFIYDSDGCLLCAFAILGHWQSAHCSQQVDSYLNQVLPFIASSFNALALHFKLQNERASRLPPLDCAGFLTRDSLTVIEYNTFAQQLLDEHCPAFFISAGKLCFPPQVSIEVQRAITALAAQSKEQRTPVKIVSVIDEQRFIISIQQTKRSAKPTDSIPEKNEFLVAVQSDSKVLDTQILSETYHLTATESQIAAQIFSGLSVKQLSLMTHRSEHTLRSNLKVIFQKLQVNSQSELVIKLANSPAFYATVHVSGNSE